MFIFLPIKTLLTHTLIISMVNILGEATHNGGVGRRGPRGNNFGIYKKYRNCRDVRGCSRLQLCFVFPANNRQVLEVFFHEHLVHLGRVSACYPHKMKLLYFHL